MRRYDACETNDGWWRVYGQSEVVALRLWP